MDQPKCPKCGADMKLKTGRNGEFWGCTKWRPNNQGCNGTVSLNKRGHQVQRPAEFARVTYTPRDSQLAAWESMLNAPVTILDAVAGSGKTSTQVEGVAKIRDVDPNSRILMLAFNKHIAQELESRTPASVHVYTTHSYGYAMCSNAWRSRFNESKYDELALLELPRQGSRKDDAPYAMVRSAAIALSSMVRTLVLDPRKLPDSVLIAVAAQYNIDLGDNDQAIFRLTRSILERGINDTRTIDFTDMLALPSYYNLKPSQRYDIVCGDEIQDWGTAHHNIVISTLFAGTRFIGAGDPYQSIYGFAGALIGGMDTFQERLRADRPVAVLPLHESMRVAKAHASLAQEYVPHFSVHERNKDGELAYFENLDQALPTMRGGDAILCRRTAPLVNACYSLIKRGIPATVLGKNIGIQLANLVERIAGGVTTIRDFKDQLRAWDYAERARIDNRGVRVEQLLATHLDKVSVLQEFTDNSNSVADAIDRIKGLFSDVESTGMVTCSTFHRYKGAETDRAFIIDADRMELPTGDADAMQQERNSAYVGLTRSKDYLGIVASPKKQVQA